MGSGFQITKLEARKPELKDCRTKSSRLYFLNGMEKLCYEALNRVRSNISMILVRRIILLVDRKYQSNLGKRYADVVEGDHGCGQHEG